MSEGGIPESAVVFRQAPARYRVEVIQGGVWLPLSEAFNILDEAVTFAKQPRFGLHDVREVDTYALTY